MKECTFEVIGLKDASNYDANKNLPSWRKAIKAGSFREMRIPHLKFTLPRPAQPNKVLLMVSPCMEQQVALLNPYSRIGGKMIHTPILEKGEGSNVANLIVLVIKSNQPLYSIAALQEGRSDTRFKIQN